MEKRLSWLLQRWLWGGMAQGINQEGPGSWYRELTEQYICRVHEAGWKANTIVPRGGKLASLASLSPSRKMCSALRVILLLHIPRLIHIYAVYKRYSCGARMITCISSSSVFPHHQQDRDELRQPLFSSVSRPEKRSRLGAE